MSQQRFQKGDTVWVKQDWSHRFEDRTVCTVHNTNIRGKDENYLLVDLEGSAQIVSGEFIRGLEES